MTLGYEVFQPLPQELVQLLLCPEVNLSWLGALASIVAWLMSVVVMMKKP